jgi:uncharacterized membrane protein HdeD (DUF308 family)
VLFAMAAGAAVGQGWLTAAGCCGILIEVILLIGCPMTALWVAGLLFGVNLIFTAAMNIAIALASKTRTSQEAPAAG